MLLFRQSFGQYVFLWIIFFVFEIIILYDSSISHLNQNQIVIRIKKLLGLNTQIEFGDFETYESRIKEMVGIVRKTQTFGNFYFKEK